MPRADYKTLTNQYSSSDSNSPSELEQLSTRSGHAEDGTQTDSDNVKVTRAFVTSNGILHTQCYQAFFL